MIICALLFVAPHSSGGNEDDKPWREIAKGTHSAIVEESRLVINDVVSWREWWLQHQGNDANGADAAKPPEVDFEKETVLVATLGMKNTGGYRVEFSGIVRERKVLKPSVKAISPGPEDMVTMALTQPFAVIAIPKHQGKVEFVER